jgi:hypothetical protein
VPKTAFQGQAAAATWGLSAHVLRCFEGGQQGFSDKKKGLPAVQELVAPEVENGDFYHENEFKTESDGWQV